jgi:hypothetical protein
MAAHENTKPRAEMITRLEPSTESPEQQEPGLRDDSDRAPIVAQTGPYKESAVNLGVVELPRLRLARSFGVGFLPKWEAHIQILEQRIQALNRAWSDVRAELLACRQSQWIYLKKLQIKYINGLRAFQRHRPYILADIQEVNKEYGRRREEAERLAHKTRLSYNEMMQHYHTSINQVAHDLDRGLCGLIAEKRDRDHQKAAPQRHADRVAWWAHIESRFEGPEDTELKRFSDLTSQLSHHIELCKDWYREYTGKLVGYYSDKGLPENIKVLLFRIEVIVPEIIGGYLQIRSDVHFARLYQRARLIWSIEPGPFRFRVEEGAQEHRVGEVGRAVDMLKFQTDSWSRCYRSGNGVISGVQASELCSRPIALVSLITSNYRDLQSILANTFQFGVLSDGGSQTVQLRRAQAAALKPFRKAVEGMTRVGRHLRIAISLMERTTRRAEHLSRLLAEWNYEKKQLLRVLDLFCLANWRCNTHLLSSRTVFQRPPSQPGPPLSPVTYTVPAGYPRGPAWNYNDYRGLSGEMVTLWHCCKNASMESVLTELKHNGVIAVDVQSVTGTSDDPGQHRYSLHHEVSVVTLSTESHIAVCHLAQMGLNHADILSPLKILLENPRIIKVGVNIKELQTRFEKYLGIHMTGTCDVASLNAALQVVSSAVPTKPRRSSLTTLVKMHFDLVLPGPPSQGKVWLHNLSLSSLRGKTALMTVKQ